MKPTREHSLSVRFTDEGFYLVSYSYQGSQYAIEMWAESLDDLEKRLSAFCLTHEIDGIKAFEFRLIPQPSFVRYGLLKHVFMHLYRKWRKLWTR